jgi:hypothetical protein
MLFFCVVRWFTQFGDLALCSCSILCAVNVLGTQLVLTSYISPSSCADRPLRAIMAEEEEDFSKLSIKDRIGHKSWKARVSGYEDSLKLFRGLDSDSAEFNQYTPLIKKMVIDSNVVAQGKALDAVLCYVETAAAAPKIAAEVMDGIVEKCLNSTKTTTKVVTLATIVSILTLSASSG